MLGFLLGAYSFVLAVRRKQMFSRCETTAMKLDRCSGCKSENNVLEIEKIKNNDGENMQMKMIKTMIRLPSHF